LEGKRGIRLDKHEKITAKKKGGDTGICAKKMVQKERWEQLEGVVNGRPEKREIYRKKKKKPKRAVDKRWIARLLIGEWRDGARDRKIRL